MMPRPRSLTPALLAEAALAVIERDGPAALSMRAVAQELGMGTMSLYRYVQSREQLETMVVDLVLEGVDLDVGRHRGWTGKATELAVRAHAVATAHPAVTPLLLARRHASGHALRWGEALLGVLAEAGFSGQHRALAFRTIVAYVFGSVQLQYLGPLGGEGTEAIAALPRDAFPLLADTARSARGIPAEAEFLGGLRLVLRGIGET
ncbi:MAG: TetR/AcrR family transcriptional regulator [Pseudomonadota bacterium]